MNDSEDKSTSDPKTEPTALSTSVGNADVQPNTIGGPGELPLPQLIPGMPGIYEIAGISLQELVNNETALKLLLHTFRQTADENIAIKQQQNFDRSQMAQFQQDKQESIVRFQRDTLEKTLGTLLSFVGTIPIAFGVNILSGTVNLQAGWVCLVCGFVFSVGGLFLGVHRNLREWFKN